jgi:hypothetical protein
VWCRITAEREIHVTVTAPTMAEGLPLVSRFAGYCARTLELTALSDHEALWASTIADYYGFGLSQRDQTLVAPREFTPARLTEARAAFNARVGALAQSAVSSDSAHV